MNGKVLRIEGLYNTLAPFYVMSGNQESVSDGDFISLDCYHSKVYSNDNTVNLKLKNGYQNGQLKKITLVHKGDADANVEIECLSLPRGLSKITFENIGDMIVLMFNGGSWIVLETINYSDPSLSSPIVS